jgi:trk system potassium uptake protein TrkA
VIHLGENDAEVLEVVAALESPITKGPLSKISLPKGVSIGGVVGVNGVTIAQGDTQVEPGDTVVVLTLGKHRKAVSKLFRRGLF